eukprot:tig00020531_g10000.t1
MDLLSKEALTAWRIALSFPAFSPAPPPQISRYWHILGAHSTSVWQDLLKRLMGDDVCTERLPPMDYTSEILSQIPGVDRYQPSRSEIVAFTPIIGSREGLEMWHRVVNQFDAKHGNHNGAVGALPKGHEYPNAKRAANDAAARC